MARLQTQLPRSSAGISARFGLALKGLGSILPWGINWRLAPPTNAIRSHETRQCRLKCEGSKSFARCERGSNAQLTLVKAGPDQVLMLLSELYQKSNDKRRFLQRVDLALQTLKDQERKIIELRYGLTGKEPMTLQQIRTLFDLSRERIRQLEARALRKLRHPSRLNRIRDLL